MIGVDVARTVHEMFSSLSPRLQIVIGVQGMRGHSGLECYGGDL